MWDCVILKKKIKFEKMFHSFSLVVLFCGLVLLLLLPYPSCSLPLCTDLRAPTVLNKPLAFCPYNGSVCCDSAKDNQLRKEFMAMEISDSACAYAVKSILCATCDPFSADLFKITTGHRTIPLLCNTINRVKSEEGENNFCSSVWDSCQNVSILNSPFAPSLQGSAGITVNSTSSKLTELWQSKSDFCSAFGDSSSDDDDESICFRGEPVSFNKTETLVSPEGMCLEKISNDYYINMVAHPDGSNRAFFSNLPGKVWLANIPKQGSGETLELDESSPFVDISDQLHFDTTLGMLGMAFHPNFAQNDRFFASFNCDSKSPGCSGRCSCNTDVNCDPSKIIDSNGNRAQACQYYSVIAEYSANGTASNPSLAKSAKSTEVTRIFMMGLPITNSHGGQILFGPADGYLYLMMGDGGLRDDPYKFAQNKKSLLGKIMRFDVDTQPSPEEIDNLGLWGNYSIPKDNPFYEDNELKPEIWALGLRNPWRSSFDSKRPLYFFCGDVGQNQYEEINLITKGGNYGWNRYEGNILFDTDKSNKSNSSGISSNLISPILGYSHADISTETGSAAISGGYVYRSMTDPCMYGSYLYADLYAKYIWAAAENPKSSGKFNSSNIAFSCAHDSPLQCTVLPEINIPSLGVIVSFGEDNQHDIYILTNTGVYRIVAPSRCNYTCSKENVTTLASPGPSGSSSPSFACKKHVTEQLGFWICVSFFLSIAVFML